jgi:flagellar hook protein FlgE
VAGKGKLIAGALEMSNVDLTDQFTDLIVTQRGFQASSKTIQTSDTMLETVLNLKR